MAARLKQPCALPLQTYCRLWHHVATTRLSSTTNGTATQELAEEVVTSPTGWAPPTGMPAPPGVEPDIPFRVRRSVYKQLPVYTEFKNGRSRILTRISKIDGDIMTMEKMLREHLQVENLRSRVDEVTGSVFLSGDHRVEVRKWLKDLGF